MELRRSTAIRSVTYRLPRLKGVLVARVHIRHVPYIVIESPHQELFFVVFKMC